MKHIIRLTALILTAFGAIGLLVHDMHVDRMTIVAVSASGALATYGIVDNILKKSDHTHADHISFAKKGKNTMRTPLPKMQARDDNRRYLQQKKVMLSGGGYENSLWPSA